MNREDAKIKLGPLTVHLPDASFSTFWFMHDLAGIFGVEFNSEAKDILEGALAQRTGIRMDREADFVFVHVETVDAMIAALRAVDEKAVAKPLFSEAELEWAVTAMRAWRRQEPVHYEAGDVVAVPMVEGRFGAGHVVAFWGEGGARGFPILLLYDCGARSREEVSAFVAEPSAEAIACLAITDGEILSGEWPVVARRPVVGADAAVSRTKEQGTISSGGIAAGFFAACAGLRAWDCPLYDVRTYDMMLLPGAPAPAGRRYLRDLLTRRLVASFGRVPDGPREGPAVLHTLIAYPGNGLPRVIDLPKSSRLAQRMKQTVPGADLVLTGGGGGYLDVIGRTSDVVAGVRAIEKAIAELRIVKDTLVECFPPVPLEGLEVVGDG